MTSASNRRLHTAGPNQLPRPNAETQPPPSTLAAQLVENISTSTSGRSTRNTENGELKRLFAVIENIKNNPDLLQTPEDKIRHNHMLIYVYFRAVLDALRPDDPFLDKERIRAEGSKAIHFFKLAVVETPSVLVCSAEPDEFLSRGSEPLWTWAFPKILRLLGHPQYHELSEPMFDVCQCIFKVTSRHSQLRSSLTSMMYYLKEIVADILDSLQSSPASTARRGSVINLELPSDRVFRHLDADQSPSSLRRCVTYKLNNPSQCLRQAYTLLSILAEPLESDIPVRGLAEHGPWLLDSIHALCNVQARWDPPIDVSIVPLIRITLSLASRRITNGSTRSTVHTKACVALSYLLTELAARPAELQGDEESNRSARGSLCHSIIALTKVSLSNRPIGRFVSAHVVGHCEYLSLQAAQLGARTDFARATLLLREVSGTEVPSAFNASSHPRYFQSPELRSEVESLQLEYRPPDETPDEPPAKRCKIEASPASGLTALSDLIFQIVEPSSTSLGGFEDIIINGFENVDDNKKSQVLELLGRAPCAADGTLVIDRTGPGEQPKMTCSFCSGPKRYGGLPPSDANAKAKEEAYAAFARLVGLPAFQESKRPRVVGMMALRSFALHSIEPEFLNVQTSPLASWCVKSLKSSVRELRIAAGRTLPIFVRDLESELISKKIPRERMIDVVGTLSQNMANLIPFLKTTSDTSPAHFQETCIMAWGQLGRIVPDQELNLVLLKLVEYFGNENDLVTAIAFQELSSIATARGTTTTELFTPFWRGLAHLAVKDVLSQPRITSLVAELLGITVNEFLVKVQSYALPWLVLQGKKDVVDRIAGARKHGNAHSAIVDTVNCGPILALQLVQPVEDVAAFTMAKLSEVSSHFESMEFPQLVRSELTQIVLEVFKLAAEGNDARKLAARNALTQLATLLGVPGEPKTKAQTKKGNLVGRFLASHVLGLMARITDVINNVGVVGSSVLDQRLCLRAMEEMIRVCKAHVRIARPQILASLLAAISVYDLREQAFACWTTMLNNLGDEDVEVLLDTTFFVIIHYWPVSNEATRRRMDGLVRYLAEEHAAVLDAESDRIPSMTGVPGLEKLEELLAPFRRRLDPSDAFSVFADRISHEYSGVAMLALEELVVYLKSNQGYLQTSAISENPDPVLAALLRSLLDCASRHNGVDLDVARLCTECIGLIGCIDSNRIEAPREQKSIVVLDNFEHDDDRRNFGFFVLSEVLVKAFLTATDTRRQGYLSFAMQELLERCDIRAAVSNQDLGSRSSSSDLYRKWKELPVSVQEVLFPFLSSRYVLAPLARAPAKYPIFGPGKPYVAWLSMFVTDLLRHPQNANASLVFEPLARVTRIKDPSVPEFLLPYVVSHLIISDETPQELRENVTKELTSILYYELPTTATPSERQEMKFFYEALFRTLDYLMRWVQERKTRSKHAPRDDAVIERVHGVLNQTPSHLIAQRALDCDQYSRALFHLELHIREAESTAEEQTKSMEKLQDIYAHIDEPDGLEGLAAHMQVLDIDQQVLGHRKAGRWTAAQTWYEIRLAEEPDNTDVQHDLLTCLKQSGQHDVLLNCVEGMHLQQATQAKIIPFAVEAAWATGRWETLAKYLDLAKSSDAAYVDFDVAVGEVFRDLQRGQVDNLLPAINSIRERIAASMGLTETASLQACHDIMLRCHVLADLELVISAQAREGQENRKVMSMLERRLGVLGSHVEDKQYLLSIQRAAIELRRPAFSDPDISGLWLSSARLARKSNSSHQSFNAVLHASRLGDGSAAIENAKLLWKDGHHRKAIQILEGAIESNNLITPSVVNSLQSSKGSDSPQRTLKARGQLLLARWLDAAGKTQSTALGEKYRKPTHTNQAWEKGHYYLGKHYKKLLESEKAMEPDDQGDAYLSGQIGVAMIENYFRTLKYGTKYLYQTLPRILTLWLEMAANVDKAPEGKHSITRVLFRRRNEELNKLHDIIDKWVARLPAYIFYPSLPQIVARVTHPNLTAVEKLSSIIIKVVEAHPRQALWSLFGLTTTRQQGERRSRGHQILQRLRTNNKRIDSTKLTLKDIIRKGEKLAEQLLGACNNGDFQSNRSVKASITRDLGFHHGCTPCPLVVPTESCLMASLPTQTDNTKSFKPFSRDVVTVDSFLDDVLVLGSLARPRRLTARGSDGKIYPLLIKPKDDLRTDQRLMEFNTVINRALKKDAESSKRQLYIRTYAVTPLNEDCGIIEWVAGLKPIRDVLLGLYSARNISVNYQQIKHMMAEAASSEKRLHKWTEGVLGMFPPVLHYWFINQFPDPSAWFAARITYTRSCAVMSMVGTILGLGDRHGENVLLEEGNGGVFHVDFNCLFDKGLTFAQPEKVPFRLTHNMVAAMGTYGYEGPFRQCSELTLAILRQNEETLMTVLEAFIYDPTLDLQHVKKSARRGDAGAKLHPQDVVDGIKRKVRGLLPNEKIPLGVEGQVEELIKQAVDPRNLTAMYIGWCPFL